MAGATPAGLSPAKSLFIPFLAAGGRLGGGDAATKRSKSPAGRPPPPYSPASGGVGRGRGQKIDWREGCLLDIFRPSGCSADSGRGGRGCRPAEGRRRGGEKR